MTCFNHFKSRQSDIPFPVSSKNLILFQLIGDPSFVISTIFIIAEIIYSFLLYLHGFYQLLLTKHEYIISSIAFGIATWKYYPLDQLTTPTSKDYRLVMLLKRQIQLYLFWFHY